MLLGCYAVSTGKWLPTFRRNLVLISIKYPYFLERLPFFGLHGPEDIVTAIFRKSVTINQNRII